MPSCREVVAVDALHRAVPPLDHVVEDRGDAHGRVQRHVPPDVRRVHAAAAAGAAACAATRTRRRRPWRAPRKGRARARPRRGADHARRAPRRRVTSTRSTSASLTIAARARRRRGRKETSTLSFAPCGQPKLQRDSPRQPCVLRRMRLHRDAEPRRALDEQLGAARAHGVGHGLDVHRLFDRAKVRVDALAASSCAGRDRATSGGARRRGCGSRRRR